jgi:signal transduction histidine kinase
MQEIHARYPDAPQSTRERWLVLLWGVLVLCLLGGSFWTALQLKGSVPQAQQILLAWPLGLLLALVVGAWWRWSHMQGQPPANMSLDDNMAMPEAQSEPALVPEVPTPAAMTPTEQELLRYAISHDLRAPLRVIDGFARILKEEEGPRMDRMSNDHLDRLLAAAGRMHTMIDAILEQAQLTQSAIERQRVDLTAFAQQVSTELSASMASAADLTAPTTTKPAAVTWLVAEGMVATGDPDMIRRILENLMGNAVKYSSKVAHPQVEVGMVQAADPTVYFVRDNGAGFDMQHAQKLFGLFQRLHSHKEFPGSGVGLAGVQIMVRRHGGRIWAEAQPGQGACFYFTLSEAQRN